LKVFIGLVLFFWLICGFLGAMWLNDMSIRNIVRGPISLAKGYNENPANYPGP
jgi:hypothetical protein